MSRTGKIKAKTAPLRRPRCVWKTMLLKEEGGAARRYTLCQKLSLCLNSEAIYLECSDSMAGWEDVDKLPGGHLVPKLEGVHVHVHERGVAHDCNMIQASLTWRPRMRVCDTSPIWTQLFPLHPRLAWLPSFHTLFCLGVIARLRYTHQALYLQQWWIELKTCLLWFWRSMVESEI